MNLYDDLARRFIADLTNAEGLKFPKWNQESGQIEQIIMDFDDILKSYCLLSIPKQVFLSKYKLLPPIELLQDSEFSDLENLCFEIFGEKGTDEAMEKMRIMHTIGILSNE